MPKVMDIYQKINELFPFSAQETWDNSGILCGDEMQEVRACVTSLDVTKEAIQTAKTHGANLIISHHPIFFSPVKKILAPSVLYDAISSKISVISAHTNFDISNGGVNDILCQLLGLQEITPYEDPALRIGYLTKMTTVREFSKAAAKKLNTAVSFSLGNQMIKKIAVLSGSGGDYIETAIQAGADCFFTGEAKYHEILNALAKKFPVITAGHFETETPAMEVLCSILSNTFSDVPFINMEPIPPIQTIMR